MIDLNDFHRFAEVDSQDMLGHIDNLPDQLERAWNLGQDLPLSDWAREPNQIKQVVIAGMGGSAIGADLLAAYASPYIEVPVFIHRDYGLPAWAQGPETLLIASSHSGSTEETLSSFDAGKLAGCSILTVSTGGVLAEKAEQAGAGRWIFEHQGQPRSAVGFSFGLLLAAFTRLGLLPDPSGELVQAVKAMRLQQDSLRVEVPVVQNLAKRQAGQLMGRLVVVIGAGLLAPVARRWKGQISEVAKAWAQFEFLPEADHNTLAGTLFPEDLLSKTIAIFLRAPSDHSRNSLRLDLTRKAFMLEGINTDFMDAQGETRMAHLWTVLHLGDYTAYYLAMLYGIDPTPISALVALKEALKQH